MEDDREMRPDEAMITEPSGDREREYRHSRREDDRERSRSRERRHRDDDRQRHRRRSYSRSRSPRGHRHRSRSPSRSRSRDRGDRGDRDRRDHRDRHRHRSPPTMLHGRGRYGAPRQEWEKSVGGPMNAPAEEAEAHAKISKRENRLYVGNLAYDVNYKDLEKFMSGAGGQVIFSEVLVTPAGQSKGCGIVEFATEDEARQAKAELSDKPFMGRSVFIREDREETARFGAAPIPGKIGLALGEARSFLGQNGGGNPTNRNIYVANLPLQASWQDLKDLMRQAGEVIRTDIGVTFDGRPKGSGTVVFVDPEGAKQAIEMFNGYDWFGNILEVREDRFPNPPGSHRGRGALMGGFAPGFRGGFAGGMGFGRGGFAGGFARGGFGGGFGGRGGFGMGLGRGGFGGRGGFAGGRGGFQGGAGPDAAAAGRDFSNDLYADYNGGANGGGMAVDPAEPNQQIYVRNLPWSTSNEDLVELFETVGNVVTAEILYDGNRSRGEGVVQFTETAEAQIAGEKFTGYMYGGRPLGVSFNKHWHEFSPSAAKGGQTAA